MARNTVTETFQTPVGKVELDVPEDHGVLDRAAYPAYEPAVTFRLSQYLDEYITFYDIGSRFGFYCKFALSQGVKPENIHAFEAEEASYEVLLNNCQDLPYLNMARVGDTLDIDDYAEHDEHSDPDIVKIDVEGEELYVLLGMRTIIKLCMPILFIEVHPEKLKKYNHHVKDIVDYLHKCGYFVMACLNQRLEGALWKNVADVMPEYGEDYVLFAISQQRRLV